MKTSAQNEENNTARAVTMNDIAKLAGVSIATVSRVLSGSNKVSADTQKKILALAKEHNFKPNESARTLVAKRSRLIAVVLPDLRNPYFTELLDCIGQNCVESGYSMVFFNSGGDKEREKFILQQVIARQADGLLICLSNINSEIGSMLKAVPIPVVAMTQTISGLDSVGIIHPEGGMLAADYLLSKNCENFYFFGLKYDEKFLGFRERLIENNIREEDIGIIGGNQNWYFKSVELSTMLLKNFIRNSLKNKRTGLFCFNDVYAANAISATHDSNIQAGKDLFIVGFDDTMLCEMLYPRLTSIQQPVKEIARSSFMLLLQRIEEGGAPHEPESIVFKPKISIRDT